MGRYLFSDQKRGLGKGKAGQRGKTHSSTNSRPGQTRSPWRSLSHATRLSLYPSHGYTLHATHPLASVTHRKRGCPSYTWIEVILRRFTRTRHSPAGYITHRTRGDPSFTRIVEIFARVTHRIAIVPGDIVPVVDPRSFFLSTTNKREEQLLAYLWSHDTLCCPQQ